MSEIHLHLHIPDGYELKLLGDMVVIKPRATPPAIPEAENGGLLRASASSFPNVGMPGTHNDPSSTRRSRPNRGAGPRKRL